MIAGDGDHPGGAQAGPGRAGNLGVFRAIAEGCLLAYLLTLAAGPWVPGWVRDPLLYGLILAGVLDALRGSTRVRPRGLLPVGVFFGVHALTIVTSSHPRLSLGLSSFTPVVAMVFVVSQRVLVSRAAIDRLFACLGLIAAVVSIDGFCRAVFLFSPLLLSGVEVTDRISASLPHPNDLVVVPMLLPFAWEWLRARGWRWLVAGVVVLGPAVAVSLLASKSRNAWLTMALVAVVWSLLTLGWRWSLGIGLAGLGVVVGLLALDLFGVRDRAGDFLRMEQDGRVGLWLVALAMVRESPWLGKGVFTFGEYYRPSWYAFRVRFPQGYTPEATIIPWAHNLVLEMLCERGIVGLASFLWVIAAPLVAVRRRLRDPRVAAAVTALAGFLGASLVDLTLMKDWVALLLFLLLALLYALGETDATDAASGPEAAPGQA